MTPSAPSTGSAAAIPGNGVLFVNSTAALAIAPSPSHETAVLKIGARSSRGSTAGGHGFSDEGHVPGRSREPVGAQADTGHVDAGEAEVGHSL